MSNSIIPIPEPVNEPIRPYAPGSPEKASLKAKLNEMLSQEIEIPLIIGGEEVRTGNLAEAVCPHDHQHVLGRYHKAGEREVQMAIDASQKAWLEWSDTPWVHRAAVLVLRRGTWEPVGGNFLVPAKPGEESSGDVEPVLKRGPPQYHPFGTAWSTCIESWRRALKVALVVTVLLTIYGFRYENQKVPHFPCALVPGYRHSGCTILWNRERQRR